MEINGVFVLAGTQGRFEAGKGCPIYLKATHEKTLELVPIEKLKEFAADLS